MQGLQDAYAEADGNTLPPGVTGPIWNGADCSVDYRTEPWSMYPFLRLSSHADGLRCSSSGVTKAMTNYGYACGTKFTDVNTHRLCHCVSTPGMPPVPPAPPPSLGWFWSEQGQSCDDACTAIPGLGCDETWARANKIPEQYDFDGFKHAVYEANINRGTNINLNLCLAADTADDSRTWYALDVSYYPAYFPGNPKGCGSLVANSAYTGGNQFSCSAKQNNWRRICTRFYGPELLTFFYP